MDQVEQFRAALEGPEGHQCVFTPYAIHVLVAEFQKRLASSVNIPWDHEPALRLS